jgi:hypothetical protein
MDLGSRSGFQAEVVVNAVDRFGCLEAAVPLVPLASGGVGSARGRQRDSSPLVLHCRKAHWKLFAGLIERG